MKYQYRESYRGNKKVDPMVVAQALEQIRATGDLTARRVVDAGSEEGSPLYPAFEHDDAVAADEYRLIQARTLIRAIVVVETEEGTETPKAPESVWVHVPDVAQAEGKYEHLSVVVQDTDEYARALEEAQRFLTSAETRFRELRVLAEAHGGSVEALAIAAQGFSAVRAALELLKVAV